MAYRKIKATSYRWPVTIQSPREDGSGFESFTMELEFRRLKRSQIEGLKNNLEVIRTAVCGWSGYLDATGAEIKFSDKELEELLEDPCFVPAAARAYFDSLAGAEAKN